MIGTVSREYRRQPSARPPALIGCALAALVLASCGSGEDGGDAPQNAAEAPAPGFSPAAAPGEAGERPAAGWDLQSGGEGVALVFGQAEAPVMRLFCPSGANELLVNVPTFRPVASEERLSFGSGGEVVALVADTRGDAQRGGVSGTGPVPANLAALVGGPIAVNHGAQDSGPHPAPPAELARGFVAACTDKAAAPSAGEQVSACLAQDGTRLDVAPRRAVGTEPFWGARIEGRCVTYSHPENQKGTRVWTRYSRNGAVESWSGALEDRLFKLELRPQPGCSDGMSDKRYPFAAELIVQGEERRGCAEPV